MKTEEFNPTVCLVTICVRMYVCMHAYLCDSLAGKKVETIPLDVFTL